MSWGTPSHLEPLEETTDNKLASMAPLMTLVPPAQEVCIQPEGNTCLHTCVLACSILLFSSAHRCPTTSMSHTTSLHTFSLLRLCPYSQGPERNRTVTVGPRRCHDTPYFVASHHCSVHPKTCLRPGLNYAPHTGSGMREQNFDTRFTHPRSMRSVLPPGCILSLLASGHLFNHLWALESNVLAAWCAEL